MCRLNESEFTSNCTCWYFHIRTQRRPSQSHDGSAMNWGPNALELADGRPPMSIKQFVWSANDICRSSKEELCSVVAQRIEKRWKLLQCDRSIMDILW
jgi:hypothetical protein